MRRPALAEAPGQAPAVSGAVFAYESEGTVHFTVLRPGGLTKLGVSCWRVGNSYSRLERGEDPAEVLGKRALFISWNKLKSLTWYSDERYIDLRTVDGKKVPTSFKTLELRDSFIRSVRQLIGCELKETVADLSIWIAALPSIIVSAVTTMITLLACALLVGGPIDEQQESPRARAGSAILNAIGPTGALAAGGLVVAGAVLFALYRISRRPKKYVLARSDSES